MDRERERGRGRGLVDREREKVCVCVCVYQDMVGLTSLDLNPLTELGQNDEVQDDRGCQERVLTGVVEDDGVVAAHEDL